MPQEVPNEASGNPHRYEKVLSHETRRSIMRMIIDGEGPLSPSKTSPVLEESVANLSYHFRELEKAGLVELVDTRPVRGSVEHLYDATEAAGEPSVHKLLGYGSSPDGRG